MGLCHTHGDLGDDPGYDDWKLVPPDHDYHAVVPAGDHGWITNGGSHVEWCRTTLPDGPPEQRVSDWAATL